MVPEGQGVWVHIGVAEKDCVLPEATVGAAGLIDTDVRMFAAVTVISVEVIRVVPLSVALTKMPTVPAVLRAAKVVETPLAGLIVPSVVLVGAHAYVMNVVGHPDMLHVGFAVNTCVPLKPTVGNVGVTDTEDRVLTGAAETVITVLSVTFMAPSEAFT